MNRPSVFAVLLAAARVYASAGGGTIAIDNSGNIWQTGQTAFLLTTPAAYQKTAVSNVCATEDLSPFQPPDAVACQHAYLTKKDSLGNILYATYLGGSSQDAATAVAIDPQGNVYIAGYTYSPDFPVTPGALQTKNAGPVVPPVVPLVVHQGGFPFGPTYVVPGGDAFVAKFAPDGTLVFSTLLGGSGSDVPSLIAVDSSGSVYVSGTTSSPDFPLTAGAMTSQSATYFFARLNATGTALTYSTYSTRSILAFDVDPLSRAYLTGAGSGGPYVTVLQTPSGTVIVNTLLTALDPNVAGAGVAIAVDTGQALFLAVSPAPLPPNVFEVPPPGRQLGASYFLTLPPLANQILAKTSIAQTQFDSILLDSSGKPYAFGHGTGAIPVTVPQLLPLPCSSDGGSFVMEFDAGGRIVAATYFRQGDDTAVSITSPGHIQLLRKISSTTVPLDLSLRPAATFGCFANLASGIAGPGMAPGEIFLLTGAGLGPAQSLGAMPDASGRYPATLSGVQVLFDSTPAPLLFVSANEIHAVSPFALSSTFSVQVKNGSAGLPPLDLNLSTVDPGIFSVNGQGAIINQDGTVNTPSNPARLGSIVSIYATGTGYLDTPVADGEVIPIPPPYILTELVQPPVTFAGVLGTTLWSGAAPGLVAGVTQINVQLPSALPAGTNLGAVPVILRADGSPSPPVFISLKP